MTVKDAVITLCFLGSVLLAILGGWNYMKGRILVYEEKVKIEKMMITHQPFLNAEEELKKIEKEKTNAIIMFAAGLAGIFLVISYTSRRKMNRFIQHRKTKQS
jgi:TRAP-type C4-dicarboxylate transport system permease small subunit